MAARGLVSSVLVLVNMASVAADADMWFTQFTDLICTGSSTTYGSLTDRTGVMTELEWEVAPTSITGCSAAAKCIKKGGSSCDTKYYSLSITCGSGNSNITVQTYRGAAADANNHCKAGNEYYKYEIMSSEFTNFRAGSCTNATYSYGTSTSSNRSVKLTGFSSSLLCGLCGGGCVSGGDDPASNTTNNSSSSNSTTTTAPATTTAGGSANSAKTLAFSTEVMQVLVMVGVAKLWIQV